MNRRQYKSAILYLKALELAAIGGTDYTAVMTTTLIDDAKALAGTMNPFERKVAWMNIVRNSAINAGVIPPAGSLSALNDATGCCFQAYSDLESIAILLECALGTHKSYPQ